MQISSKHKMQLKLMSLTDLDLLRAQHVNSGQTFLVFILATMYELSF